MTSIGTGRIRIRNDWFLIRIRNTAYLPTHYPLLFADVAPSRELQEKLAAEFKGHSLLEACRQADPQRLKKFLGADIINFKHPYTGEEGYMAFE